MGACSERGVDLAFFSPQGKFLARVVGKTQGNVLLRQQQYRAADDPLPAAGTPKDFARQGLQRSLGIGAGNPRPSPARPGGKAKALSQNLAAALPNIENAVSLEELRGLEGAAAQQYFDGFDSLILQQHDTFAFAGRNRRPPLDPINALLSFSYTLLARDCAAALEGVGLDPYVGFLHRPRPGAPASHWI